MDGSAHAERCGGASPAEWVGRDQELALKGKLSPVLPALTRNLRKRSGLPRRAFIDFGIVGFHAVDTDPFKEKKLAGLGRVVDLVGIDIPGGMGALGELAKIAGALD